MAWAFDPAKYQSQEAQNKHSHCQEVHQAGTYGKSEEYEVGQLSMFLQEHPVKRENESQDINDKLACSQPITMKLFSQT